MIELIDSYGGFTGNETIITYIDKKPQRCPYCYKSISAEIMNHYYIDSNPIRGKCLYVIFACPDDNCGRLFLAVYRGVENFESWALDYIISEKAENKHIDDYISKISLQFVEIYQESSEAERLNLLYVCGAGYRKALEVLVKDYAISIKPDDKDDIENKLTLVTCIEKYLSTPKLKEIARRASWLGNDEVHYKKKWGEEVTKLRGAINLVVHFILQEKEANNLLEEMTKPKK